MNWNWNFSTSGMSFVRLFSDDCDYDYGGYYGGGFVDPILGLGFGLALPLIPSYGGTEWHKFSYWSTQSNRF